jgi:uncharacterized membrane protein YedE/YeeE
MAEEVEGATGLACGCSMGAAARGLAGGVAVVVVIVTRGEVTDVVKFTGMIGI